MITIKELNYRKGWSLQQKIDHTLGVIDQFYSVCNSQVYIAFSGGKDSTVLMHLIRTVFDSKALGVFANTGNEYPDIVKFVRSFSNVKVIYPELTVREVVDRFGFPLISKLQAKYIREARNTKNPEVRHKRLYGKPGKLFPGVISKRYRFLVDAPFMVSEKCCDYLKKNLLKLLKRKLACIRYWESWPMSLNYGNPIM